MQNLSNIHLLFGKKHKKRKNKKKNYGQQNFVHTSETINQRVADKAKNLRIISSTPGVSNSSIPYEENFVADVVCENNFESETTKISQQNVNRVPQKLKKNEHPKHPYIIEMMKKRESLNKQKNVQAQLPKSTACDGISSETLNTAEREQAAETKEGNGSTSTTAIKTSNKDVTSTEKNDDTTQEMQANKVEEGNSSHSRTETNVSNDDLKSTDKVADKNEEHKAANAPDNKSAVNIPPKIDGQTIEIRLTHEIRQQKEKPIVIRPNSTKIEISQSQGIKSINTRFSGNVPILTKPQPNVLPTAVPYNRNQGYMNHIQNNQQYSNVTQNNQFLTPQPIQHNQLQTQQVFTQIPHPNQAVPFGPNVNMPNMQGIPTEFRYVYPKGIPRSFYQGQEGFCMANLMTLNLNPPQGTPPQMLPQILPVQQHTYAYSENMPVNNSYVYNDNPNIPTPQQYSPSQIFANTSPVEGDMKEGSVTPDFSEPGHKRLSAFERLGPVTKPKKPKLTINLMVNKENSVREVVDESKGRETDNKYTPVYLRQDIRTSTDPTVIKYLKLWPWKKTVHSNKSVTVRTSKTVMLLELEQMDEFYNGKQFNQVTVRGYPSSWTKEQVLDAVLESVKGCSMIPCFIEFTEVECKFLVFRCRLALLAIHKYEFVIRRDDIELIITVSNPDLGDSLLDFVPVLVLKQRLSMCYDGEAKLNLSGFTIKSDISNFLYFPLNRVSNQTELTRLQNVIIWGFLVELDLSHNRITTIHGFCLPQTTPKLKHLNLSHNLLEKITVLLSSKGLPLKTIRLEGNPMCTDYTDPQHYVKVIKMIYPSVTEIDGIPVTKGRLPPSRNNYCPDDAKCVVEKFLEVYFPLWDSGLEQRALIKDLYDTNATLTNNFTNRLRRGKVHDFFPTLFQWTRTVYETEYESETVEGDKAIVKLVKMWPELEHDPFSFTVDVLHHDENTTIIRIGGLLKLTTQSLADEEHLLSFTRTVILRSKNGFEYKIMREWVLWDEPREECAKTAFQITTVKTKRISLELKSSPDNELKEKLTEIFMQITSMERKHSQRCLEIKNWHLRHALEYFSKLLKLGDISCLTKD